MIGDLLACRNSIETAKKRFRRQQVGQRSSYAQQLVDMILVLLVCQPSCCDASGGSDSFPRSTSLSRRPEASPKKRRPLVRIKIIVGRHLTTANSIERILPKVKSVGVCQIKCGRLQIQVALA